MAKRRPVASWPQGRRRGAKAATGRQSHQGRARARRRPCPDRAGPRAVWRLIAPRTQIGLRLSGTEALPRRRRRPAHRQIPRWRAARGRDRYLGHGLPPRLLVDLRARARHARHARPRARCHRIARAVLPRDKEPVLPWLVADRLVKHDAQFIVDQVRARRAGPVPR